ncbi:MAG: hypothetical protein ABW003_26015 [Microvirga sp.]
MNLPFVSLLMSKAAGTRYSHSKMPTDSKASDPADPTNAHPSFKLASTLFVASLGSFIGASLLLASL